MDPEQIYQEVLQEEQAKGSSAPVAEGRAKAARVRTEHGSPHPKEAKWWPGAQPHLEGGEAAPAEVATQAAEDTPAAPEPVAAEAPPVAETPAAAEPVQPAAEAPAVQQAAPSEQAAAQATEQPMPAAGVQPGAATPPPRADQAPAAAAVAAPQPAAPAVAPRPGGVTHGTTTGTRLRPEDEVSTEAQFEGQRAVFERRKVIDELVGTGVPAVAAETTGERRAGGFWLALLYVAIPLAAIAILASQRGATEAAPPPDENGGGGGGGAITVVAEGVQFDTDTIELPANEPTPIQFENRDSVQHNIHILTEPDGESLFDGDIIGPGSITYQVPALEAGNYFFLCDVHPDSMTGDVVVQ